ncbi:MAG: MarR family transcriptional regulator [Proteobacteria bacterium]|nr:MarR family transcriptional regulator [Pseudomonadota bacterium]
MDERSLLELIYASYRLLAKLESVSRDYGTGELLFSADIHTVVEVDRRPGCNLTQLAESLNVSKPAAFKFVKKMLAFGYLLKDRPAGNRKEVSLRLSEKGKMAIRAHAEFEKRTFGPLMLVETGLSPKDRETIKLFLQELEKACSWK